MLRALLCANEYEFILSVWKISMYLYLIFYFTLLTNPLWMDIHVVSNFSFSEFVCLPNNGFLQNFPSCSLLWKASSELPKGRREGEERGRELRGRKGGRTTFRLLKRSPKELRWEPGVGMAWWGAATSTRWRWRQEASGLSQLPFSRSEGSRVWIP